jgi:hypothetical protein
MENVHVFRATNIFPRHFQHLIRLKVYSSHIFQVKSEFVTLINVLLCGKLSTTEFISPPSLLFSYQTRVLAYEYLMWKAVQCIIHTLFDQVNKEQGRITLNAMVSYPIILIRHTCLCMYTAW